MPLVISRKPRTPWCPSPPHALRPAYSHGSAEKDVRKEVGCTPISGWNAGATALPVRNGPMTSSSGTNSHSSDDILVPLVGTFYPFQMKKVHIFSLTHMLVSQLAKKLHSKRAITDCQSPKPPVYHQLMYAVWAWPICSAVSTTPDSQLMQASNHCIIIHTHTHIVSVATMNTLLHVLFTNLPWMLANR